MNRWRLVAKQQQEAITELRDAQLEWLKTPEQFISERMLEAMGTCYEIAGLTFETEEDS